jgi:hypothetical protein
VLLVCGLERGKLAARSAPLASSGLSSANQPSANPVLRATSLPLKARKLASNVRLEATPKLGRVCARSALLARSTRHQDSHPFRNAASVQRELTVLQGLQNAPSAHKEVTQALTDLQAVAFVPLVLSIPLKAQRCRLVVATANPPSIRAILALLVVLRVPKVSPRFSDFPNVLQCVLSVFGPRVGCIFPTILAYLALRAPTL